MKRSYQTPLLVALLCAISWMSCQSTQTASTKPTKPSEEELLNLSSMERLIAMQTGHFLMYDSAGVKPRVFSGQDSLCLYGCPVGEPNKDGYWIFQKMYMSSIPDEPLSLDFLHFKKISRDSFEVQQYKADKKYALADQKPSLLKEIDFNGLENVNCPLVFEKLDQLHFEGTTPVCTIYFDGGKSQMYANFFSLTPVGFFLHSSYYKKIEGEDKHVSNGHCYFKPF